VRRLVRSSSGLERFVFQMVTSASFVPARAKVQAKVCMIAVVSFRQGGCGWRLGSSTGNCWLCSGVHLSEGWRWMEVRLTERCGAMLIPDIDEGRGRGRACEEIVVSRVSVAQLMCLQRGFCRPSNTSRIWHSLYRRKAALPSSAPARFLSRLFTRRPTEM